MGVAAGGSFQTDRLYQPRSLMSVFSEASTLYLRQGAPFNRQLLWPIFMIHFGIYATLLLFSFQGSLLGLLVGNPFMPVIALILMLLGFLLAMGPFFWGFWQYVLYFAALNRSFHALVNGQSVDFWADYQAIDTQKKPYLVYLNALIVVQVLPLLVGSVLVSIPAVLLHLAGVPEGLVDFITNTLLGAILLLVYTWFSFGFQIIALEPLEALVQVQGSKPAFGLPAAGVAVVKRSVALVRGDYWRCAALLLLFALLTGWLLPGLAIGLLERFHVMALLDAVHLQLVQPYVQEWRTMPGFEMLSSLFHPDEGQIAAEASKMLVASVLGSILLPWGTFAYALLYGDVARKKPL